MVATLRHNALLTDYTRGREASRPSTRSSPAGRGPASWSKPRPRAKWCARHLEQLGHEVIVADPNFAPMYVTRDKKSLLKAGAKLIELRARFYRRSLHRLS